MWLQNIVQTMPFLQALAQGTSCTLPRTVYGLPTWYAYLPGQQDVQGVCRVAADFGDWNAILGIGIAFIEILLRIGALVAVGYIVYAGFQYITSNGDPERAKHAKDTILNALIGLVIAIAATGIVVFLGSRLG